MNLRAPSYPLIAIDPYFSVWSSDDRLNASNTVHWTGRDNVISAILTIDGRDYRVMSNDTEEIPAMTQTGVDMTAFSTVYTFEDGGVRLRLTFSSPILPNDLYYLTRPVSYLQVKREIIDGHKHTVSFRLAVSEQICMNFAGDDDVACEEMKLGKLSSVKMGKKNQTVLPCSGDDLRIEWGYFYLSGEGQTFVSPKTKDGEMSFVGIRADLTSVPVLFSFAYDDIASIEYFHTHLKSYWNREGAKLTDEIVKAHADYKMVMRRCREMENQMFIDAVRAGGEKYAELLELSFRQTIAAHKLVLDEDGQVLFISKECYSNGCAATVDVSYPSIPLFLLYNPELVKGMMRPIYKYAKTVAWTEEYKYDFAPHDAGRYPILNGQMYGYDPETKVMSYEKQMPVEECGNMLIMEAAVAIATKDTSFANEHMELLEQWVKYLLDNGSDPGNQLCTDDFAGHLAHNCNLSLKAIMGIAGLGIIYGMNGRKRDERKYMKLARELARDWAKRAANSDGSYRLAFDKPDSFSMKYNIVWDKLFGTNIMPREVIGSETASYKKRMHPYGLPLDNRLPYTKSDWTVWTAALCEDRADFEAIIEPMWNAFNYTPSRVPMCDWYWTETSLHKSYVSYAYVKKDEEKNVEKSFRNRTVQGGLFIKLLEYKGIMKY